MTDPTIVHVLAADVPADRHAVLAALVAQPAWANRTRLIHVGAGPAQAPARGRVVRVHAPASWAWFGARMLRRRLAALPRPLVLHAWSATAARWAVPLAPHVTRVLVEVAPGADVARHVVWPASGRLAHTPVYICQTDASRRRLRESGVPAECCRLIRPGASETAPDPQTRATVRRELRLDAADMAVLVLPPITRATGALIAAWGALLAEKTRPALRLVLPPGGREGARIRRLVTACRHERMFRAASPGAPLGTLLAAADLATYLPRGDAPLYGLVQAAAAGVPLVAADTVAVREVLAEDCAWFCQAGGPADAARALGRALVEPSRSTAQAHRARAVAQDRFTRARLLTEYATCLQELG